MKIKHIVNISGGKDSAATRLIAIERGINHIAVFADTGNEHPLTYEWIKYFEEKTGPIITVRADFSKLLNMRIESLKGKLGEKWRKEGIKQEKINKIIELLKPTGNPFLDLCLLKGRFPSTRARFCSSELKHRPIREQIVDPLLDEGNEVVSWQGVRWDESQARSELEPAETIDDCLHVYRPILSLTANEVFDIHHKHNIEPNPLYRQGMARVGCMPCIHSGKNELKAIASRFPEEIKRISEWESIVSNISKWGFSSFFSADKTPKGRILTEQNTYFEENDEGELIKKCKVFSTPLIYEIIDWAKTDRGGKQYGLFVEDEPTQCSSIYGLCE